MKLSELIQGLPVQVAQGSPQADITDVVEDSRQCRPGCLFVARPGTQQDGRRFINDAVAAGAVAVLAGRASSAPDHVAVLVADNVARAGALIAERFCGNPSQGLHLIGVTGTNGKTTTAHLIHQLLNRAGLRCGLMGTVQVDDGRGTEPSQLTTPPAIELSRLLRRMVDHGCRACVMEASSHALHQHRTAGLAFHAGVFTNLTGDHLDYHGSMDAYSQAKALLFQALKPNGVAVVNADDPRGRMMIEATTARVLSCSLKNAEAKCHARIISATIKGTELELTGPWGRLQVTLPLVGRHNAMNAVQAAAVCSDLGLDPSQIRDGLQTCSAPPGRLEPVSRPGDEVDVFVDYAHTDDALENVLSAVKPFVPNGAALRVVFGCGGDRDRSKRPRMAAVAARFADDLIITSDNPRTENPHAILAEIVAGLPDPPICEVHAEIDRERAIHLAIERAEPGDVVVIAGKGHEDYQIIGTVKRPFDDRLMARAALAANLRKAGVG